MTKIKPVVTDDQAHLKINEKKWGEPLMKAGWTCLPNTIIYNQDDLGLDPLDVNIVLYLASRWWKADGKPHPSKAAMAKSMGVSTSTIRRRIKGMEASGFLKREYRRVKGNRNETNIYHLEGLIKEATPFAKQEIDRRESKNAERNRIEAKKGRSKFKVVTGG